MLTFSQTRQMFDLPPGIVYLDGNSLGPLPRGAAAAASRVLQEEWGKQLITAWNGAGWFEQPTRVGDRIARLVGADRGSIVVGDTLSIKVFQAVAAALALVPKRKIILSDSGNFPSDLYMADRLIVLMGQGHRVKIVEPEDVEQHLSADVAVLLLTEVDYRTGRRHDMANLTSKAQAKGIVTVWDLAHSAGAFPVALGACNADFAVGCTYKYLNGGPGAPAFIYVAPRHAGTAEPVLAGWMGHDAPFTFARDYRAGQGISRMRVGTPPVIQMAVLEAALDIWDEVDVGDLRAESVSLSEQLIAEVEAGCPELKLISPRNPDLRGSHVSFAFPQGYAAMQALIARGVIGDFRAPDILRFGICSLFNNREDILAAASTLKTVMTNEEWRQPQFNRTKAVT